ncbi:MAG TPA: oligosaccharide flippase family protein [Candidatus Saccharimonadales bacterium]|nr:oligosaccharide flippase family protein [Candidatus Saccharimonadales bacterium]
MGYTKDVIKGVSWAGALSFLTKAVGFLETLILARILAPAQFGAYGIALLALGLLETLTETGVNIVLVQEKETAPHISSAWIVSIGRGLVITLLLYLTSPFIASFFHSPTSLLLLQLISIVPFLRGFINPAVVTFQKELKFRKYFWYQAVILFVDTAVSIIVTLITRQPIGIVIGLLSGVAVELAFSFLFASPRPTFSFQKEYVSKIFHRGKWITLSAIFNYLFFNADNIAVGRLLGAGALGVYQLGYSLAVMPLIQISVVFGFVTFPIFTKLAHDRYRLKNAFLRTIVSVFILSIPFVILFVIFPEFFVFILGEKWKNIIIILPILSLLGIIKSLTNTVTASLFLSEVKQNYSTTVTVVTIVGMLATLIPFIHMYGIFGAALSALTGAVIAIPFIVYYTVKIFRERSGAHLH